MNASALAEGSGSPTILGIPNGFFFGILIAALIIAGIVIMILFSQMKTAHFQSGAGQYELEDTFRLDARADFFTHETVRRRKIEEKNN